MLINIILKPYYEIIQSIDAIGLDADLMFSKNLNKVNLIFGINDCFSYKKWSSDTVERFYPKLQILLHFTNERINYFFQAVCTVLIHEIFLSSSERCTDKNKPFFYI